jgi:pyruvate/2-oxoglutarate/acetoin dehydrogenase E1 component
MVQKGVSASCCSFAIGSYQLKSGIARLCRRRGLQLSRCARCVRVAGKDCPIPYAKELEEEILPQKKDFEVALRQLIQF